MSETIPYVYVVVLAFIWRVMSMRKGFSFQIFDNYEFKNKNYLYLEKFIMFLLPVSIAFIHFLEICDIWIIKILLICIILLDILLQYFYKSKNWIVTGDKYSKEILWWIVLAVIILIIV